MHNTLQTKATEMAPQSRATGMSLFSMAWAGGQAVGAALMGAGASAFGYAPMIAGFAIAYAALGFGLRARLIGCERRLERPPDAARSRTSAGR